MKTLSVILQASGVDADSHDMLGTRMGGAGGPLLKDNKSKSVDRPPCFNRVLPRMGIATSVSGCAAAGEGMCAAVI